MNPSLLPVPEDEKPVLRRLLELHLHDLSQYTGDELGPDGSYGYRYLDFYWIEENRKPFYISIAGRPVGFVLIRLRVESLMDPAQRVHHLAEFFVLRKYRRLGIGRSAAWLAFDAFPGRWEVAQVAGHAPALAFWRNAVDGYTQGDFVENMLNGPNWHGTVQAFTSRR